MSSNARSSGIMQVVLVKLIMTRALGLRPDEPATPRSKPGAGRSTSPWPLLLPPSVDGLGNDKPADYIDLLRHNIGVIANAVK